MKNYIAPGSTSSLIEDLTAAIKSTCSFMNPNRFIIKMGHQMSSNHSDIVIETGKKSRKKVIPKISSVSVNLAEESELVKLINQHQKRVKNLPKKYSKSKLSLTE